MKTPAAKIVHGIVDPLLGFIFKFAFSMVWIFASEKSQVYYRLPYAKSFFRLGILAHTHSNGLLGHLSASKSVWFICSSHCQQCIRNLTRGPFPRKYVTTFWFLDNMYSFENVGFSNAVSFQCYFTAVCMHVEHWQELALSSNEKKFEELKINIELLW